MTADKAALRAVARAAREALDAPTRAEASARACRRVLTLDRIATARTVAAYAPSRRELDVTTLTRGLLRRGVRVVLPRVADDGLELVAVTDLDQLVAGYRGIREPAGETVDPTEVDVVVVPGLAFDRHGGRLGQGGGHFDRLLATLGRDALRVGVAFAFQLVDAVPLEPHDQPVDLVVTESGVLWATPGP